MQGTAENQTAAPGGGEALSGTGGGAGGGEGGGGGGGGEG